MLWRAEVALVFARSFNKKVKLIIELKLLLKLVNGGSHITNSQLERRTLGLCYYFANYNTSVIRLSARF